MDAGEFQGRIGRYHHESEPWWPPPNAAAEGSPNVIVVLLDDTGFAQLGPYGSDLDTPTFDRLAAGGLTFTNFHTTALCSPTRACLLTGRNHHSVGMGRITDLALGFPGYHCRISKANGFLPEMLVPAGYAGLRMVGKWHLTPRDLQHLGASPATTWPLGPWFRALVRLLRRREPPVRRPPSCTTTTRWLPPGTYEDGYHLTEDLVDHAIDHVADLRNVDPDKPFFLYVAPGACHSPHQAPAPLARSLPRSPSTTAGTEWRERTASPGRWRAGIVPPETTRALSPRPDWVPAWAELDGRRETGRARATWRRSLRC